ncbi:SPOR domain-containing protein [Helcobacillus massiliensis]|uniref:SPOR domain-containing protein n=1 Tax=Helcobacillus massiliensis TaxID=521392 RepID=A0A839QUN5_9MICO|nr:MULTISPECIES: SPOR domain-containing protein [Helcobacillus]MBB3022490.1 hypothetical protein [Helcobacillus massiliensis]MCG7426543.1 SPOR domain-containing protein [Helcobacillus sp. ACRRO]MCT1557125.1 SPOR domain-containing protein [Helcobacillus massiliensis]MCT2036140.1 SPOR domain-containing protein [Helcobacillus massiliensis]MCT2331271.1 SPOR domain-containing protein [Helcobacillus massiliensis]
MTEFFYNLTTKQVEEGRKSPGDELMGPYATADEAKNALAKAEARNQAWDAEDREWEEG